MSPSNNERLERELLKLDSQHEKISSALAILKDLALKDASIAQQEAGLKELVNLLHAHFNCENLLFADFGYPRIAIHMKEHKRMLEEINSQYQMIKNGEKPLSAMLSDYLEYLDKVHIAQMDQDYMDFFKKALGR